MIEKTLVPPRPEVLERFLGRDERGNVSHQKICPIARDYAAVPIASSSGLRINEAVMLDVKDWSLRSGRARQCMCGLARDHEAQIQIELGTNA